MAKELTQTKLTKHCAKIAVLAEARQGAVQPVQTAPRDNFKTKPRKHRAKIVLSIHLQIKPDKLPVKIAVWEKNRKEEVQVVNVAVQVKQVHHVLNV